MNPHQRFTCAIEYTGKILQAGSQAFEAAQELFPDEVNPPREWLRILRPIRILAKVDWNRSPTLEAIEGLTKFHFRSYGGGMQYISRRDYDAIFKAIKWDCRLGDAGAGGR
jgi:hypothetical protein